MEKFYSVTRPILSDTTIGTNPRKLFYLPEDVLEWAARVCYKSTHNFHESTDFLTKKVVEQGHLDILEHGYLGIKARALAEYSVNDLYYFAYIMKHAYPFMGIVIDPADRAVQLNANVRVWHELYKNDFDQIRGLISLQDMQELILALTNMYSKVFTVPTYLETQDKNQIGKQIRSEYAEKNLAGYNCYQTSTGANVILLSKTNKSSYTNQYHATFQLNGVSRALTHQLVRHRLLSFSQQSQRYVDGTNFQYVTPHVDPDSKKIVSDTVTTINEAYRKLRQAGVKKQDARCLLPNAAVTEIVVSGERAGWEHFLKLRTAKDAQDEIRQVALAIQEILESDNGS